MGSLSASVVELRPVEAADTDALFEQMRDLEPVQTAAFTPDGPDDRQSFDTHMAKVSASPDTTSRVITCDGRLAGSIASFVTDGRREVTYWVDRAAWGRHIAGRALTQLLDLAPDRPLHARAASDNAASLRVLEKAGFEVLLPPEQACCGLTLIST